MRELNYYIRQDLTVCPMYAGRPMWIATAAMLAASVASSLIGGAKSKKAAKKQHKKMPTEQTQKRHGTKKSITRTTWTPRQDRTC